MAAPTPSDITCLPIEVMEKVLGNRNISVKDVVYFSMTCKTYNSMINGNNTLWRSKFFQRWPSLIDVCKAEWSYGQINVHEEIIERMKCPNELCNYFSTLNEKYLLRWELSSSDLRDFGSMFRDEKGIYSMKFYYLLDDLTNMLNTSLHDVNLTHIYYTKKVLLYMKQCRLKDEWLHFKGLPLEQQVLERVLAIAHQWFSLDKIESVSSILAELNRIADKTCKLLTEKSLFSKSTAQINLWRYNNIEKHQWEDPEKAKEMLHVIHHILYEKFGQVGIVRSKLHFMIAFHAIARTFGIRCDVVHSTDNIYLIWGESYDATSSKYKKINILNILSKELIFETSSNLFGKEENCSLEKLKNYIITPTKVMTLCYEYMSLYLKNILKDYTVLEFHHMVNPQNIDTIINLAKTLVYREMDLSDLIGILNAALADVNAESEAKTRLRAILETVESKPLFQPSHEKVYRRVSAIKYAIGMIAYVKDETFPCIITGWKIYPCIHSSERNAASLLYESSENVISPHYNVYYLIYTDDGLSVSAYQDDVEPVMRDIEEKISISRVLDGEIGRYFSYFKGTHFIPSPGLEKMFPDDAIVREQWLSQINSMANQGD